MGERDGRRKRRRRSFLRNNHFASSTNEEEKKWRFGSIESRDERERESGDFLSRKLMHEFTSNNGGRSRRAEEMELK